MYIYNSCVLKSEIKGLVVYISQKPRLMFESELWYKNTPLQGCIKFCFLKCRRNEVNWVGYISHSIRTPPFIVSQKFALEEYYLHMFKLHKIFLLHFQVLSLFPTWDIPTTQTCSFDISSQPNSLHTEEHLDF